MATLQELRAQIGQLLIIGVEGAEPTAANRRLYADLQPGGVILFRENLKSAEQCFDLLADCRAAVRTPMFACVDLEGGLVDRLRDVIAHAPPAEEVFATRDVKMYRAFGQLLGREARALGFNVDFAPVSDLGFARSRRIMASRVVSDDAKKTILWVREFLRGLKRAKVLGCGKHFPGLGEGSLDSHHELPVIEKPWQRLWAEDLAPYRALHRQFPFVMVAHAAYPAVTGERQPASISRQWMTDILRKKIGYKGLVLSDDLEMGGAMVAGSVGDVSVESMKAGADMLLVCHKDSLARESFTALLREAERDRTFARRIREAAQRVLRFKARAPEMRGRFTRPSARTVERLRSDMQRFRAKMERALAG